MSKKYSYWIHSGKYAMMQKMLVVVSGLFTFMLLARMFPPATYGVWGLFITIAAIIETARNALIKNGYVLFINKSEEEERPGIEFAALSTNWAFSFFLVILFFLSASWLENLFHAPGLASIFYCYSLTLLLLVPFSQREIVLNARMDFRSIFWMYFFRNGSFLVVIFILFLLKRNLGLGELAIYYGLSILVGFIGGFLTAGRVNTTVKMNKQVLKKFIHYGKYVFGNNLFSLVFRNTDSFMTARFISPTALAFYNTSIRVTNFADLPSQVLGDVMFPKAAQIVKKGKTEEIKNIYEKTVAATLTFILPVILAVWVFTKEIIVVLAGEKYLEAAPILQVTILYGLFLPFIKQFGNIMDATGRPKGNFIVMMSAAVFNVFSNLFFIQKFGVVGAAYGTLFSYFVLFLITQVLLIRLVGISHLRILKNTFNFYPDYIKLAQNALLKALRFRYEK